MKTRATLYNPGGSERMIPPGATSVASADFRKGDLGPFGVIVRRVGNTTFSHENVTIGDHEVLLTVDPTKPTHLSALATGVLGEFDSLAVSFASVSPIDGFGLCVRLQAKSYAIDLFEVGVAPRNSHPSLSVEVAATSKVIQTYYSSGPCPPSPTIHARVVNGSVMVGLGEDLGSAQLVTSWLTGGPYSLVIQTTRTSIGTQHGPPEEPHVVAALNWAAAWKRGK